MKKRESRGVIPKPPSTEFAVPEAVIRKLAELLRATDLSEIEVTRAGLSIRVKARETQNVSHVGFQTSTYSIPSSSARDIGVKKPFEESSDLHIVRSPFIGTFYRASTPANPVFVETGQTVTKGQTLCIVEAMKLMNEIEADASGVVEKIFVENGTPVEFNTALFGIRKT